MSGIQDVQWDSNSKGKVDTNLEHYGAKWIYITLSSQAYGNGAIRDFI